MTEITSLAKQHRLHVIDDVEPFGQKDKPFVERLRLDRTGAERLIFGDDASYALGQWIAGCEDIMLDNLQFAKTPFPKTYMELTLWRVHQGLNRAVSGPWETADDRIGFLIVGNHVRSVITSRDRKSSHMGLFEYWMETPESKRLMGGPLHKEVGLRAALLLGSSYHTLDDADIFNYIINGTRIRCFIDDSKFLAERVMHNGKMVTRFEQLVWNCCGEMRTLWAALLMLNQHRKRLNLDHVPREARITARGRKVYLAHTLITIPMSDSPEQARKTFYPDTRASPVGHRVRAHWRDYHKREGCVHEWPLYPDDDGHYKCAKCPGYRRRIENFHRGRSDSGYNLHTYEVTP